MTTTMTSTIARALNDLPHEAEGTRRVLASVPAEHLEFKPHPKSWPLKTLAKHVAGFSEWGVMTLASDGLDLAAPMPPEGDPPKSGAEFVALFDKNMEQFQKLLAEATDDQLMATWTLKMGDHELMAMPRIGVLRNMVVSHMIHHRAQLTMYLRLLDVPMPGLYGPSADEQ